MSFALSSAPSSSQIIGSSTTPTIDPASRILSSGSVAIEGTNISGKITFTVTGVALGSGKVMTMTYAGTPPYPTGTSIVFAAGNSSFAGVTTSLYGISSKTGIDLYSNVTLALGTYIGYYQVIGY